MYAQRSAYIAGFISLSISSNSGIFSTIAATTVPHSHGYYSAVSFSQIVQIRQFGGIVFLEGFFPQFGDFGSSGLAILI